MSKREKVIFSLVVLGGILAILCWMLVGTSLGFLTPADFRGVVMLLPVLVVLMIAATYIGHSQ